MDFFDRQRYYKRRVLFLYGLFFLVIALHCVAGYFAFYYLDKYNVFRIKTEDFYQFLFWLLVIFGAGYGLEHLVLLDGSANIAKHLKAKQLIIDKVSLWASINGVYGENRAYKAIDEGIVANSPQDLPMPYKKYYEIAEQMSIASGVPMPTLFVLDESQAINAFVLGRDDDLIMVITQGALDKLDDESLYGIIAYGYAKILHGDSAFNVEMLKVLSGLGLLWLMLIPITYKLSDTHWLERFVTNDDDKEDIARKKSNWRVGRRTSGGKSGAFPILIVFLIVSSALCFAYLIKRVFCKNSVLLADATSVQLTRSMGVYKALKAIEDDEIGAFMSGMSGYDYLFFDNPNHHKYLGGGFLAGYPSMQKRLSALENYDYQERSSLILKGTLSEIV